MEKSYMTGLTVEEAIDLLKEGIRPVKTRTVPLTEAADRILAQDIYAEENIPPFDRSPYDGYAFRSEDIRQASPENPVSLSVIEEIPAGHAPQKTIGQGQAAKILTGAPVPKGADAVEMFEKTEYTKETVTFTHSVKSGSNICLTGEDIKKGNLVAAANTRLTPAVLGILAGLGQSFVTIYEKVKISIISTGDELVPIDAPVLPGKIRNSSSFMLMSLLNRWGMDASVYGIVPDDKDSIGKAIRECAEKSDVVVTTGGVSVGDYDMMLRTLEALQAKIAFWKVKMKPGMAFLSGIYKDKLLLCLSGNPSAAAAALHMVGRPVLLAKAGLDSSGMVPCKVRLMSAFPKKSPMRRFIPGILRIKDGEAWLDASLNQANGVLSSWHGCNVIADIKPGTKALEAGCQVDALYIAEI